MKEETAIGLEVSTSRRILVAGMGTPSTVTHGSSTSTPFQFSTSAVAMSISHMRHTGSPPSRLVLAATKKWASHTVKGRKRSSTVGDGGDEVEVRAIARGHRGATDSDKWVNDAMGRPEGVG